MNTNNSGAAAQSSEVWDFKEVAVPAQTNYLKMGNYILSVKEGKFVQPEGVNQQGAPKTPYLEITFTGEKGQVTDKFFVSPKTLPRLQYLHIALTGKSCERVMKSAADVGAYYEAMCNSDKIRAKKLHMTIAGQEADNGKIYGCLPYSNFVCPEEIVDKIGWSEGEFPEGSSNWTNFLVKSKKNISHTTDSVFLPDAPVAQVPDSDMDSLPF